MANPVFDPEKVLGTKLTGMDKQELCEFISALCRKVVSEVGSRGRRGGIYPDNISVDENGIALGQPGKSPLMGQELEFAAPEIYWNGSLSAASDVYSVGMLMYYAFSGGKLPLEGECEDPHIRRMGGGDFPAPRAAGHRIGEIIERCIKFRAAERYQTLEELRAVLDSCIKNLYLSGIPSAEAIFKKNDDDLSEVERMMLGILENKDESGQEEEEEAQEQKDSEECLKLYSPPEKTEQKEVITQKQSEMLAKRFGAQASPAAPKYSEPEDELEPVMPIRSQTKTPAVQYTTRNLERERKIAEEVKKRRRRPLAVILVLCAVLVMVAILMNAMLKDFQEAKTMPDNQIAPVEIDPYAATMSPSSEAVVAAATGQEPPSQSVGDRIDAEAAAAEEAERQAILEEDKNEPLPQEHRYELVKADVSWTQAQQDAIAKGGYLVVISSTEELNRIVSMAENQGVTRVWIGCHRENGVEVWEKDNPDYAIPWAKGEPTYVDVNDQVSEDYVMLWNNNGWACNDNRDDPCKDYPAFYSGTMGYVIEYGEG